MLWILGKAGYNIPLCCLKIQNNLSFFLSSLFIHLFITYLFIYLFLIYLVPVFGTNFSTSSVFAFFP